MKLRNHVKLIPRNNWDYGFQALFNAFASLFNNTTHAPYIENIFQQKPIWSKSGRTSLYAILKSLELPMGAKVGVPLFCCSVVFNAICQAGLSPRFLDSNINDYNISVEDFNEKHSDLAAVVAVHMFGNPCDMDAINAVADTIPVVEDCAQSIFSTYKGKQTGLLSTASFFSFRCGKYISAGEGSAVFCNDLELKKKIEQSVNSFENWSTLKMFINSLLTFVKATLYNSPWYGLIGYPLGMRLDKKLNLTAKDGFETGKIASTHFTLINTRITNFQEKINIQRKHAHILLNEVVPSNFSLPSEVKGCASNWYQFALRFQNSNQRDVMAEYLLNQGIDTAKYLDNIVDEARSIYGYNGDCPNAELLSKTVLLVPIHYTLRTRDIEYIARSINEGTQLIRNL
jgi:dTDP-4-amino-4,6-dideoxygalactose transaminase